MTSTPSAIRDFHAHIYFDPTEVEQAKLLGAAIQREFWLPLGHFHLQPVGPHPRGSCQVTVPAESFGAIATWLSVNRNGLTIFAHAATGDHLADHSRNVIWFGPSEALNLDMFR